jgi:hypothetical protein
MKVVVYSHKSGMRYNLFGVVRIEMVCTIRKGREVRDYRFLFDDGVVRYFNISSHVFFEISK